jgi:glutathione S-transferase
MITLYELAGADSDRRFSPYCWRIRLALRHKDLPFDGVAWRLTEKDKISFAGSEKVPVLIDGAKTVHDSPAIAAYLEETYPERPSLFGGKTAQAVARFVMDWNELVMNPALFRLIAVDIGAHIAPKDKDYFTRTREARVGMTLEEFCADRENRLVSFRALLAPLRRTLSMQPFISGDDPAWADYVAFGSFQWARCVSPLKLLEGDDPVHRWRERMLDLFDGEARKAVGYPV